MVRPFEIELEGHGAPPGPLPLGPSPARPRSAVARPRQGTGNRLDGTAPVLAQGMRRAFGLVGVVLLAVGVNR